MTVEAAFTRDKRAIHVVPSTHVMSAKHGDETILLDLVTNHYYALNETAGKIWALLCEGTSIDGIVQALAAQYSIEGADLMSDVDNLINTMMSSRLVQVGS